MTSFLNFIFQPQNELESGGRSEAPDELNEAEPEKVCPNCHRHIPLSVLEGGNNVCVCGHHFRMSARQRISFLVDPDSFTEIECEIKDSDPIGFPGYEKKIEKSRAVSGEEEGVVCGTASIRGQKCCIFVMEPYFMMGSMGVVVGERIANLFDYAADNRLPVVGFTVSGGARMQEGLFSLMQMAKTSATVKRHSDAGLFYLTVLTDPTTGGVTASFAMEGDIIIAEPGATVGFAGARVVEQTTRRPLPKGFQTAESLLEHGFVDAIIPRKAQKKYIAKLLEMHSYEPPAPEGGEIQTDFLRLKRQEQ